MSYPNYPEKHSKPALIHPEHLLEIFRKRPNFPETPPPEAAILCYQNDFWQTICADTEGTRPSLAGMRTLAAADHRIGVAGGFGIGAPAACSVLEALIIFGVKRFVSMGAAGSLQPDLHAGDLVICDKAIRDEGTSYHYLADSKYAYSSQSMLARLLETAQQKQLPCRLGSSWTTDAPYRETLPEIRHYQEEGVATVEMEASALFAVAAYRGVELGSIFTISDLLTGPDWEPHFDTEAVAEGLRQLFEIAVASLL